MISRVIAVLFTLLTVSSCSAWRDTYTLSPAVKESARRYSDVMDDFADQALLANVLRARDQAPMNFNDLSSITGSLSLSGTLGFTLPFGPYNGYRTAMTLGAAKNTASPSITTSTSPIINLGTLNTQGFMLTMIQPISSTYVLSKWNEGLDHRLLLYLFVKSIRFCDDRNKYDSTTGCAERVITPTTSTQPCEALGALNMRRAHTNDPDDPQAMDDFIKLVNCLFDPENAGGGDVDLKSLMILDPLGIAIPFGESVSAQYPPQGGGSAVTPVPRFPVPAPANLKSGMQLTVGSEMTLFGTISGLADGQLHVGNANCPFGGDYSDLCLKPRGTTSYLQFYKEYPAQIVMCVNTVDNDLLGSHRITPISETAAAEVAKARVASRAEVRDLVQRQDAARTDVDRKTWQTRIDAQISALLPSETETVRRDFVGTSVLKAQLAAFKAGGNNPQSSGPSTGGGTGGGGGAQSSGGGGGASGSGGMSQVTMALIPSRISAIIPSRYCQKDQLVLSASTEEEFDQTTTGFAHVEWRSIAEVIQYLGALARHAGDTQKPAWTVSDAQGTPQQHQIFAIRNDAKGRITVDYGGTTYSTGSSYVDRAGPSDHSLQSLALLNELISIAKISGTLPVSQPVQVLP